MSRHPLSRKIESAQKTRTQKKYFRPSNDTKTDEAAEADIIKKKQPYSAEQIERKTKYKLCQTERVFKSGDLLKTCLLVDKKKQIWKNEAVILFCRKS